MFFSVTLILPLNRHYLWAKIDTTFIRRYDYTIWKDKVSNDYEYQKKYYVWMTSIDKTVFDRIPFKNWLDMVSKK